MLIAIKYLQLRSTDARGGGAMRWLVSIKIDLLAKSFERSLTMTSDSREYSCICLLPTNIYL